VLPKIYILALVIFTQLETTNNMQTLNSLTLVLAVSALAIVDCVATVGNDVYKCGRLGPLGSDKSCPAGYFCPAGATPSTPIVPVKCPAGSYCPAGTCTPVACGCGHKCPAGSFQQTKCRPPFYCSGMNNANMTLCPIGFSCGEVAMCEPKACFPGSYVSCAGKKSCDLCSPGRYCPTATSTILCPAGSYCPLGASAPTQCPANQYCPLGSAKPRSCPPRKSSDPGCKSVDQCK